MPFPVEVEAEVEFITLGVEQKAKEIREVYRDLGNGS